MRGAVVVPERVGLRLAAFPGPVLRRFQAAAIGFLIGLDRGRPLLRGAVFIGGFQVGLLEALGLFFLGRGVESLIERREFRAAIGGADHAHAQLVIVAPPVEFVFVVRESVGNSCFGMDQINADVDMGVRLVGMLDDDGLVILQAEKLQHVMGGLAHVFLAWLVVRVPFDRNGVDGLFELVSSR